jgi:hypothetical protein
VAAPIAFSALITSVQRRANIDNQAGPITLPEIREYLNSGLSEYWDFLVEARAMEFIRKSFVITTVASVEFYTLPVDFYELISGDVQVAPGQFVPLLPFGERERNMFKLFPVAAGVSMSAPFYYRIIGNVALANVTAGAFAERQVHLIPMPPSAYTVTLNYVYRLPIFDITGAQDGNVIDSVNNWTDYAVWSAVADCKNRLKEDPSYAMAKCQSLRDRIAGLASMTDAGRAERIVDADDDSSAYWWGY